MLPSTDLPKPTNPFNSFFSFRPSDSPSNFCCVSPTSLQVAYILLCNASKAHPGLTVSVLELKSCKLLLERRLQKAIREIIIRPWSCCCNGSGCPVTSSQPGLRGFQIREHEQREKPGNCCLWDYILTGSPSLFSYVDSKLDTRQTKKCKRARRKQGGYNTLIRGKSYRQSANLCFCTGWRL